MSVFKLSVAAAASGVLMLTGLAQVADAAYIVGPDGFDVPPYTLNAAVGGQQGWVEDALSITSIKDTGNASHGTAIYIDNDNGGNKSRVHSFFPAHDQSQILRVKFDVYGSGGGGYYFNMPVAAIGDYWGYGGIAASLEGMGYGGGAAANAFRLNGDSSLLVPGITSSPGVWYTVTVDLSYTDKTYDITITDGTNTGTKTGVPFWSGAGAFSGLNDITFRTADTPNNPYESGYFDNLSVEMVAVPEPASVALLGMGLSALVLRRRR
ncbi:MAG: PEP-CTERM sorting domain-containing protein [Phycisphaerales bacterium]|nr:PEP-CTERM sorting domain-containing protein [Phycisphaerales bacterium]